MTHFIQAHGEDLTKGFLGSAASFVGFAVSLSDVEVGLRITSLLIGIIVGLLTIVSLVRKLAKPQ